MKNLNFPVIRQLASKNLIFYFLILTWWCYLYKPLFQPYNISGTSGRRKQETFSQ